jgi:hypothetical protein
MSFSGTLMLVMTVTRHLDIIIIKGYNMENIDFLNKKNSEMKTMIAPGLQEKIDYVLGKAQGYILYPAIKVRLEKQSEEIREEILSSEEFNKYCLDYVLGETKKGEISFSATAFRLSQLEQSTREFVLKNEEFKKSALHYLLAKGQNKISLSEARKRMELIPEELRAEIAADPEVLSAYPDIV